MNLFIFISEVQPIFYFQRKNSANREKNKISVLIFYKSIFFLDLVNISFDALKANNYFLPIDILFILLQRLGPVA
jgi:hypothetical protein